VGKGPLRFLSKTHPALLKERGKERSQGSPQRPVAGFVENPTDNRPCASRGWLHSLARSDRLPMSAMSSEPLAQRLAVREALPRIPPYDAPRGHLERRIDNAKNLYGCVGKSVEILLCQDGARSSTPPRATLGASAARSCAGSVRLVSGGGCSPQQVPRTVSGYLHQRRPGRRAFRPLPDEKAQRRACSHGRLSPYCRAPPARPISRGEQRARSGGSAGERLRVIVLEAHRLQCSHELVTAKPRNCAPRPMV